MGGCTLNASGRDFEVDRFLAQSGLVAFTVWRRGEPTMKGSKQESMCSVALFNRPDATPDDLVEFLGGYLESHRHQLDLLRACRVASVSFSLSVQRQLTQMPKDLDPDAGIFGQITRDYFEEVARQHVSFVLPADLLRAVAAVPAELFVSVWAPDGD
jgi:hypothetical protein